MPILFPFLPRDASETTHSSFVSKIQNFILSQTLLIQTRNQRPTTHPSMADEGNGNGGGDVVDRPKDEGGPMEVEAEEQQPVGAAEGFSAEVGGGEDDGGEQTPEVEDEPGRRAPMDELRASVTSGAVGAVVEPSILVQRWRAP